ncbi:hypothetical protein WJX72_003216 [[Myrmecia] bisecta]|uniref:PTM/DIR17-like Tudor domain-containing protein n=1 Tax=[Myrmecia] bisecta TaxID=41462 RepID=A0AAW1QPV4_9CHLO
MAVDELIGRTVRKYFGKQHGWFEGVVQSYTPEDNLFQIIYPADNDREDMTRQQVLKHLKSPTAEPSNPQEGRAAKRHKSRSGQPALPLPTASTRSGSPELGTEAAQAMHNIGQLIGGMALAAPSSHAQGSAPPSSVANTQDHNLAVCAYNLAAFQSGRGDQEIRPLTDAKGTAAPAGFPKTVAGFYQLATPGPGANQRHATLHKLLHFYKVKDASNHVYTQPVPALPSGVKLEADVLQQKLTLLQRRIT